MLINNSNYKDKTEIKYAIESKLYLESVITDKHKSLPFFINYCLNNKKYGYYHKYANISNSGDFITSPEVSQLFGETIAIWLLSTINKINKSQPISIIEYGPGNGTLMKDIIRIMLKINPRIVKNKCMFYLVETSNKLIKIQKQVLTFSEQVNINWLKSPFKLPKTTSIIIANEFLDVLPIHQWKLIKHVWHKSYVIFNEDKKRIQQNFIPCLNSPFGKQNNINRLNYENSLNKDDIIETSPWRDRWWTEKNKHISKYGGAILIIDYGYIQRLNKFCVGSTLQAVRNHTFQNIFENIGLNDITSHVDFSRLKAIVPKHLNQNTKLRSQANFLCEFGIIERTKNLLKSNKYYENQLFQIRSQINRLIAYNEMGKLFKVIDVWANP